MVQKYGYIQPYYIQQNNNTRTNNNSNNNNNNNNNGLQGLPPPHSFPSLNLRLPVQLPPVRLPPVQLPPPINVNPNEHYDEK
jgi:hypothetical protein